MTVDLGVKVSPNSLDEFAGFAEQIGLNALGVPGEILKKPFQRLESGVLLLGRIDIRGKRLPSLKKTAERVRRKHALVAIRLMRNVEAANWAAEDNRIDLITLNQNTDIRLRSTTSRIAARSDTVLEVQLAPLLHTAGLDRSRLLKVFRENVSIATDAGMKIVVSSGAEEVLNLRSPRAIQYIATLLGIDFDDTLKTVHDNPEAIIKRNLAKLSSSFVAEGVSIVQEGTEE